MSLLKPHPLILALCAAGLAQSVLAATTIEPNVITVGKETSITITTDHADEVSNVTLTPGGPTLKNRISINNASADLMAHFNADTKTPTPIRYNITGSILDVAINNDTAYIANGDNGLTLLDISTANQPRWISSHQKLGNVTRVATEGQRVLALNDAGILFFISTDNPNEPTTLGAYRTHGEINNIALDGQQGLVLSEQHIDIIDFSFQTPQISNEGLDFGQGVNFGGERRVFINDDIAYVADWFSGIHIYDISQPASPNLLSSYHTPGSPKGVVVRDDIAYVADDDHGLQIIDVHDPRNPKQISTLLTPGLGYTPKLVGDLLFLASHRGGFQIIDVKNPARPQLISDTDTPGKAWSIEIKDQLAYIADDDTGLLIYDVHNPALPQLIGQFNPGTAAEEVIVRDNFAYVAFFDDGLYLLDISNPRRPVQLSHTAIPGNARGLDLVDDTLYVASWLAGVHVLDVSNVKQPRIIGSYDTRGATWGLKVKEDYLFAMDWWGGFTVLDIRHSERPTLAGSYHHRGRVEDIAAAGNYAFVASGENGLQVFDIKNPLNPTWTTGTTFPGTANKIALQNSIAYIAAGAAGLAVVDISNPFNVRWLGNHRSHGNAIDIIVTNDTAAVLNEDGSITSFDLSTGSTPHKISRLNLNASAIAHTKQNIFITTPEGLHHYLADEGRLRNRSVIKLDYSANQIATSDGWLAASQGKQLTLYKISAMGLAQLASWSLDSTIEAIRFGADKLYLSCDKEIVIIKNITSQATIGPRYQTLGPASQLTLYRDTLYSSGDETIRAIRQLPETTLQAQSSTRFQLTLPASVSEGSYNLVISKNGSTETIENVLNVTLPHFSKPKLSMESFKILMEQKKSTDLFTNH